MEEKQGESERGSKKQGDCAIIACQPVHIDCLTIECNDNHDRVYVHNNCPTASIVNNLNCV